MSKFFAPHHPMPSDEREQPRWFWLSMLREVLIAGSTLWLLLFVLENLKSGLVSNYFSLPGFGLILFVLACLYGSFLPQTAKAAAPTLDKKQRIILSLISLAVLLVFLSFAFPWYLTLLFSAVTVGMIWLGTQELMQL